MNAFITDNNDNTKNLKIFLLSVNENLWFFWIKKKKKTKLVQSNLKNQLIKIIKNTKTN